MDSFGREAAAERCWDNYRNRWRATNDTRAENHVLPKMDLWGKKEEKKNGEPEEKVTEPIVRGRKLSRGCFEEKNIVRWKVAWGRKDFVNSSFRKRNKPINKNAKNLSRLILSLPYGRNTHKFPFFLTRISKARIQLQFYNSRHRKLIFNRDPTQLTHYHWRGQHVTET